MNAGKIARIAANGLDGLLDRGRAESWRRLVLIGPNARLPGRIDDWPDSWKAAGQLFWLVAVDEGLIGKLQLLRGLTSLDLISNEIGAEGAKAIAASLTGLTSLNLGNNNIGAEGTKAIAALLPGLTSLDLRGNNIGTEGAAALLDALSAEQRGSPLVFLDLTQNGGLCGLLPNEVLMTQYAPRILAAYRRSTAKE